MVGEQLVVPDPAVRAQAIADFTAWVTDHHRPLLDKLVAPSQPELRTNRMVATADSLWVDKVSHLNARHLPALIHPEAVGRGNHPVCAQLWLRGCD